MRDAQRVAATIAVFALAALFVGGCGDDAGEDTEARESVSAVDLQEDGDFWLSLGDELQRELAAICHSEEVQNAAAPEAVQVIQDFDDDDYVAFITDYYVEQGGTGPIDGACAEATKELAAQNLSELQPHLPGG